MVNATVTYRPTCTLVLLPILSTAWSTSTELPLSPSQPREGRLKVVVCARSLGDFPSQQEEHNKRPHLGFKVAALLCRRCPFLMSCVKFELVPFVWVFYFAVLFLTAFFVSSVLSLLRVGHLRTYSKRSVLSTRVLLASPLRSSCSSSLSLPCSTGTEMTKDTPSTVYSLFYLL